MCLPCCRRFLPTATQSDDADQVAALPSKVLGCFICGLGPWDRRAIYCFNVQIEPEELVRARLAAHRELTIVRGEQDLERAHRRDLERSQREELGPNRLKFPKFETY